MKKKTKTEGGRSKTNGKMKADENRRRKMDGGMKAEENRRRKMDGGMKAEENRRRKMDGGMKAEENRRRKMDGGMKAEENRRRKSNGTSERFSRRFVVQAVRNACKDWKGLQQHFKRPQNNNATKLQHWKFLQNFCKKLSTLNNNVERLEIVVKRCECDS